jgi:hypothetical protein
VDLGGGDLTVAAGMDPPEERRGKTEVRRRAKWMWGCGPSSGGKTSA